jgi:hypothetical protein
MLPEDKLNVLSTYIDGKMKRYGLLFSVNGGAFAIAKLHSDLPGDYILGDLDMKSLALGAILFTEAMTVDIWAWGERMKRNFSNHNNMVFTAVGKIIVGLLASLLILAWGAPPASGGDASVHYSCPWWPQRC